MAPALSLPTDRAANAPQVVVNPRRTDAVGDALRQAFGSSCQLPEPLSGALRRLDVLD